jgi:hypothetical protein
MEGNYYNSNVLALANSNRELATGLYHYDSQNENYRFIESKSGNIVPCDDEGIKSLHSKIDPEREGKRFLTMYKSKGFLIFLGLGGAYHIKPFIEKNEFSTILIIDKDIDRFKATISKMDMKHIFLNPAVNILIDPSPEELYSFILNNYIPAVCGDVTTIPLRQRVNIERDFFNRSIDVIKNALDRISDDYTVQTRFGKKWFINSLFNLSSCKSYKPILQPINRAIITGAGPSLEEHIDEIRFKSSNHTIIATDTSVPVLLSYNIRPDIIVSIDCQHISYYHFLKGVPRDIPIVLDLSSPRKLATLFDNVYYFTGEHPFSQYVNKKFKPFPNLRSTGGSVTHGALALADALNAKEIELYGADFSYPLGKSYSRGSYIYDYFSTREDRKSSLEASFYSFIMDSRDIVIESCPGGLRYITKPMIGYKRNLEQESERISAKLKAKTGKGCKIDIKEKDFTQPEILPLFTEGNNITSLYSFLKEYRRVLNSLPDIIYPVEVYHNSLTREQKMVWLTIIPVLSTIRGDRDLNTDLLKEAVDWMIYRIDRHIEMEEQKKGA